jgi:hypothetical protein
MFYRRNWIAPIVVILGFAMFVPVAQAQRQEWEGVGCYANTYNVVHSSPEVGIASYDGKGIIRSTGENKLFDNWTLHFVALLKREGDKVSWKGLSKMMAPDGEFIISEYYGDLASGNTSKIIYGTGKWKGVKGESKGKIITTGKAIVQGTGQLCEKWVGWIELPK